MAQKLSPDEAKEEAEATVSVLFLASSATACASGLLAMPDVRS